MDFKPFFSTKSSRAEVTTYCGLTHVNFTNMTSGVSDGGKLFSAVGTLDTSVSCLCQQSHFRFEAWGSGNQICWVKTSYCKNQWIRGLLLRVLSSTLGRPIFWAMLAAKACLEFYNLLHQCSCSYLLAFFSEYVAKIGSFSSKVAKK